jgi:hypothetical protein
VLLSGAAGVVTKPGREVENGSHRVILEDTDGRGFPRGEAVTAEVSTDAVEWLRKQVEAAPDPVGRS